MVERIRGHQYTNEEIYELCDVPEATVDELVAQMTDGPVTLITAFGCDHYTNGHTFYTCVMTLLMMTGNLGKHGAGITGPGVTGLTCPAAADVSEIIMPEGEGLGIAKQIHAAFFREVVKRGRLADEEMTVKSIYTMGSNFLASQAGRREWIDELLPKIEFLVVADIFFNDTAQYADIVLPVSYWFEMERFWPSEGYMVCSQKVQDPLGESKSDIDIISAILTAMGKPEGAITRDEFMMRALDNDSCKSFGITWDSLKRDILVKCVEDGFVDALGLTNDQIALPEGRFSFYMNAVEPQDPFATEWDYDRERMLYWEPPLEAWPDSSAAKAYPLQFLTKRSRFKAHTFYTYSENLLELMSEPFLMMNPADAKARGIAEGDYVRTFNDRSEMTTLVYFNPGIRPGIVQIDHGWMYDQFKSGHYADPTTGAASPACANNNYFDCMCEVEKA